ncbi:MAG: phosphodiester glycosidase family protein [Deltaproteobacteria bacterium]|nr:phosphodiester glycosidase family protein [Deltaproteobacteria bacterium]
MTLLVASALATTLAETSTQTVDTGVTLTQYRASSPSTDVWVLRVDLCADDVYVEATRETASYETTGSWASDSDLSAATNGDFYKTDPVRVYGDAHGGGVRWPSENTGWDTDYDGEWYWEHYGWIAFGHDEVWFSHTGWVKDNVSGLAHGIENTDLTPTPPGGVIAMVSGFPELVVEGVPMVCADPEASDCFPDRSDMRDRHPRTAMGITEDMGTFLLVVADGRTGDNDGLYGSELADIMGQLGAWEAFNLDGGGSSQMWTDGDSYVNDYDGNNYGDGARTVANHWGIFAGGRSYLPARPGHCASAPPCDELPPAGGVLDDAGACFRGFGDQAYWRDESSGYGGSLRWTNAFEADQPDNWAWWRVELEEAGDYEVMVYASAEFSVFDEVEYEVRAAGTNSSFRLDPSGHEGWLSIGTYAFAAGGDQWVALFDHQASDPGSNEHIVADAVQLVRVGQVDEQAPGSDTGVDTGDSDAPALDSGPPGDDSGPPGDDSDEPPPRGAASSITPPEDCGCGTAPGGSTAWILAIGMLGAGRRR